MLNAARLMSLMLLGYVADGPAFMGNIVGANPDSDMIMISHFVVTARIAGFIEPSRP